MKDPLRIPRVLESLSQAWESQPDLTLPQLYGVLESRGIAWNSTDDEVTDVLAALIAERPALLPADAPGRYLVETEQPAHRITLDPWWAAVRPARQAPDDVSQPVVWRHGGIRRCAVGQPLTVLSAEGTVHRFGLVSRITVLTGEVHEPFPGGPAESEGAGLDGLRHDDLDGHCYLVRLAGDERTGTTVLVDRALWVFDVSRREVHRRRVRWSRLESASVGNEFIAVLKDGGTLRLPAVEQITVLE